MTSPVSFLTDEQYAVLPIAERRLMQARAMVGVREVGRNAGPEIERILKSVGLGAGYPYCAASEAYWFTLAGLPARELPRNPRSVFGWWQAARLGKLWKLVPVGEARRGDAFFWCDRVRRGGRAEWQGHIGAIAEAGSGFFRTIEANTDGAGSRDGGGIWDSRRSHADLAQHEVHGVIRYAGSAN